MNYLDYLTHLFPTYIAEELKLKLYACGAAPEEIRVRISAPITIRSGDNQAVSTKHIINEDDILYLLNKSANHTFHTAIKTLQEGYIPLRYGCRMGVCGIGGGENGALRSMYDVTSVCIRIANEIVNCSAEVFAQLYQDGFKNTLIIAPPGGGKTTLLRDLVRTLSYKGFYIGLTDERGEVSGIHNKIPSFDLGPNCDTIIGMPKKDAAMILIRTMSPDIVAMDEISASRDLCAIEEATCCGVGLLTTIHGNDSSFLNKSEYKWLRDKNVFAKAVIISKNPNGRSYTVKDLYD